jgi:hypothetical protein
LVFLGNLGLPGEWYPQEQEQGPIEPIESTWSTLVYIDGPSIGTEIKVAVLVVDYNLHSKLNNYIAEQDPEAYEPYKYNNDIEENIKDSVTPIFKGHH